jgi:hypothetical protein
MNLPIQRELSKLLREQQAAIDNYSDPRDDDFKYLAIEQSNKEIWALRNKYACGSTWGKDPAFDKWWVKQVAKARNLNIIRQIVMWAAIALAIFYYASHPAATAPSGDDSYPEYSPQ